MKICKTLIVSAMLSSSCVVSKVPDAIMNMAAEILSTNKSEIKMRRGKRAGTFVVTLKNGKKYVLRVFNKKQGEKTKAAEICYAQLFSELGISPKFVGANKEKTGYMRERVSGRALKQEDVQNMEVLKKLAAVVRKMHDNKSEHAAKSFDSKTKTSLENIEKKKIALPTEYLEQYDNARKTLFTEQRPKDVALCHNSLSSRNIILGDDGNIYLVNTQNAGDANTYDDLAYMAIFCWLDGEGLTTFMEAYLGHKPEDEELSRLTASRKRVYLMMSALLFERSELQKDKKISMEDRSKALDKIVESRDESIDTKQINDVFTIARSHDKRRIKAYAIWFYKRFLGKDFS